MKRLVGYWKPYWKTICVILVLLIAQAFGELALPEYTSRIVDTGLQASGIEHAAPERISEESMQQILLLLDDAEAQTVQSAYTQTDDGYVRGDDVRGAQLEELDTVMETPEALLYQMTQSGEMDPQEMVQAYEAGMLDKQQILEMREQAVSSIEGMSGSMLHQLAVQFVVQEYRDMGIDLNHIQRRYLWMSGAKMLFMTLMIVLAAVLVGLMAARTAAAVSRDLRGRVFRQVVSYSTSEINQFSTASLITRSTNDIQQIQMVTVMMLRMVLFAPVMGIGGIIKVVSTHTGLGWIIAVAVAATLGVVFGLMSLAMPRFKKMQTLVDNVNRVSREILTGIMPIRAFSREKHEEERFDEANIALKRTQLFTNRIMTFMMPSMMLIMYCVMGMIVWFGAQNIDGGLMQVGDLTAFLTYTMQIVMSFMLISMISIMLPRAGVAADRVYEVMTTEPTIHDTPDAVELNKETARGEVEFHDVSFRFPGGESDALEHISFKAEPGKTTAIIGSTGCGKSTLINLILRFYDVTSGFITVDGVDIRTMTQHSLRDLLGYVPQKGILFSGDIESNLKFGGDAISNEEMVQAAEIAQATEFIDAKVDRYHSAIAQGGSNVSGGQKQRLSIARAIAKHPKIFLFDDSFSALDYKTDSMLRRQLKENVGGATVILVAQRISTILHADQIIVLNEGRIDGIGTHEQLMRACRTYQEIAHSQLSAKELGLEGGMA